MDLLRWIEMKFPFYAPYFPAFLGIYITQGFFIIPFQMPPLNFRNIQIAFSAHVTVWKSLPISRLNLFQNNNKLNIILRNKRLEKEEKSW